jgi:GT2 family glycosyltransferase
MLRDLLEDLSQISFCRTRTVNRVVVMHNLQQPDWHCPAELNGCCRSIENHHPKGFAANHNTAFAGCDTEWFAVVNPDIRLNGDVFSALISHAKPHDAVLAPALIEPGKGAPANNRGLLTLPEIIRRRLPGWRPADDPAWLPGAFLLIRAQAFREVGGFDERYFLYAEDFDLCARLRLAGWALRYVPEVQVIHAAQRSSHVRWRYLLWHVHSLLRLWTSRAFWQYRALLRREARAAHRPR